MASAYLTIGKLVHFGEYDLNMLEIFDIYKRSWIIKIVYISIYRHLKNPWRMLTFWMRIKPARKYKLTWIATRKGDHVTYPKVPGIKIYWSANVSRNFTDLKPCKNKLYEYHYRTKNLRKKPCKIRAWKSSGGT